MHWVIRSIPHSGAIELFSFQCSTTVVTKAVVCAVLPCLWDGAYKSISRSSQCSTTVVTKAVVCAVLPCLWDGAYKRSLAANYKEEPMKWQKWVSSLAEEPDLL